MSVRFPQLPVRTSTWITVILLTAFLAFLPSLDNDFVNWDDDVHLLENQAVRSLSLYDTGQIFRQHINRIYLPLTTFSFAIEHHFAGYNPFIYHFDNVLLHVLNTLLIFVVCRQLGLANLTASLAALIFGVHPVHVESVAWVTERKDVLYAFFYLSAIYFYLRFARENNKTFFALSWLSGLLSMLAKPMALSLPLILLLCDWYLKRGGRQVVWEKFYYALYIIPLGWLTYLWNARVPSGSLVEGWLTWIWCFSFYIKKFILPEPLLPIYRAPTPASLTNPEYFFSLIIFVLVAGSLFLFRKNRLFLFAFGFYFLSVFFLLRFDTFDSNVVADRFAYLPVAGLCIIAAKSFEQALISAQKSRFTFTVVILMLMFTVMVWMNKTQRQCDVWQNGVTLWRHQLKNAPTTGTALVYHKLGHAYTQKEKFKISASRVRAFNQGQVESVSDKDIRRVNKALQWQLKALEIKPDMLQALFFTGKILQDIGKPQEAEHYYQAALFHQPNYFLVYVQLGKLYYDYGDREAALAAYNAALRIGASNPYAVAEINEASRKIFEEKQRE